MPAKGDNSEYRVVVRPHEHVAVVRGHELALTCREYEIIRRLVEHPGWVFSAEQLAAEEADADYSPESVSVLVSRLRRKLAEAGVPDAIDTVRGFGYRLRVPGREQAEDAEDERGARARVRDALWRLQEVALAAEHDGSDGQRRDVAAAIDAARRAIEELLGGVGA